MKSRGPLLLVLALSLGMAGCVRFKQPKEFKNRKSKEDPPILDHAPFPPKPVQLAGLAVNERT